MGDICASALIFYSSLARWSDPVEMWLKLWKVGCGGFSTEHRLVLNSEYHCFPTIQLVNRGTNAELIMAHLNRWLRGDENEDITPAVQYLPSGEYDFKALDGWHPPAGPFSLFLDNSTARAAAEEGLQLASEPVTERTASAEFDHPTMDSCSQDYLFFLYSSEPLSSDRTLAGTPQLYLYLGVDVPDVDVFVELYKYNQSFPESYRELSFGIVTRPLPGGFSLRALILDPGPGRTTSNTLDPTGAENQRRKLLVTLHNGRRLRIRRQPSRRRTLAPPNRWQKATIWLHHGPEHPSRLILPILKKTMITGWRAAQANP